MRAFDALPRIAELSLEAARRAGSLARSLARTVAAPVLDSQRSEGQSHGSTRNGEPPSARTASAPPAAPVRPPAPARASTPVPAPPAPAPAPAPPEPVHVERDAVVVAESADAGAAEGAGAELRVAEPWDGYVHLKAKDVIAQLATADPATLAVVRLYESTHRKRRTVLAEIDRRLAMADG